MGTLFEDENVLTVPGPDGNPVTVSKAALSPESIERIKSNYGSMMQGAGTGIDPAPIAAPQAGSEFSILTNQAQETGAKDSLIQNAISNPQAAQDPNVPSPAPASVPNSLPPAKAPAIHGLDLEASGIRGEAKAAQTKANTDFAYMKTLNDNMEAEEKNRQAMVQRQQDAEAKARTEITDNTNQMADFKFKNFWADRSTGAQVAAAISIGLGAYSSAMTGGPNAAMSIVNSAMDRDMELQKLQYQKLKDKGSAMNSVYGQMMQQYGNERDAEAATKAAMLQRASLEFQKSAALMSSQQAGPKANQLLGQLQSQREMQIATLAAQQGKFTMERQDKLASRLVSDPNNPNGPKLLADSDDDAKQMKETIGSISDTKDKIHQLKTLVEKNGSEWGGKEGEHMTMLRSQIIANLKKLEDTGRLGGESGEVLSDQVPDPSSKTANAKGMLGGWGNEEMTSGLDNLSGSLTQSLAKQMQARGLEKNQAPQKLNFESRASKKGQ